MHPVRIGRGAADKPILRLRLGQAKLLRRSARSWRGRRSGCRSLLRLHPVEHAKGRVHASLGGFPLTADDTKLSISTAHEEAGSASRTIVLLIAIIVIAHAQIAPPVSVTIPAVAAFPPTSIAEIVTVSR